MPASKAQRAKTAERRGKAVAMRTAGLDYDTIAQRLGYASRGAAHTDITRALEANVAETTRNAEVLREAELLRLDRLQAGVWPAAAAGDPRAIDTALRIIDRRSKYSESPLTSGNDDLSTVVGSGDRRLSLEAIRDKLAHELQTAYGKDCAPLAQRLVAVMSELEVLTGVRKGTADELAVKRAARRAAAAGSLRT
jgi:hypothetical protein